MAEQEQNRTEKATPYKLNEARKKGQVAKSIELNATLILLGIVLLWMGMFDWFTERFATMMQHLFAVSGRLTDLAGVLSLFSPIWQKSLLLLVPIFLVTIFIVALVTLLQTGPVLSFHPIKPDFKRLNPVEGVKKLFSKRVVFELVKNSLKLTAVTLIVFYGFYAVLPTLLKLVQLAPDQLVPVAFNLILKADLLVVLTLFILALLDFLFVKWEFSQRMMMSRRELKDEYKKREGDPDVKQKRKKIQSELLQKTQALGRVKDADVIITNPTRIAIAICYKPDEMISPEILAMGTGPVATKIRELAADYNIMRIENKSLARFLLKNCTIGQAVPESAYSDVAAIYRWLYKVKGIQVQTRPSS